MTKQKTKYQIIEECGLPESDRLKHCNFKAFYTRPTNENITLDQNKAGYRLTIPATCNNKEDLDNIGISMNVSSDPGDNTQVINIDMNSLFNVKVINTSN